MSEAFQPAIVAIGYDRPKALACLLDSLRAGAYPAGTPLIISLDHSDIEAVSELARSFEWPFGPKRIIQHPVNLGLREHVLRCGDLALEYGAVILFEDDLLAAPHAYDYVRQAMDFFATDDRIGGIALYHYLINEFDSLNFRPVADGSDIYFLQVAASWGQAWTAAQWRSFRTWYADAKDRPITAADQLPRQIEAWKPSSWKKYYIKYLVETGRYFVYPRVSLSTNTAKPGVHMKRAVSIYQTPIDLAADRHWRFLSLEASLALYDVFYEPKPEMLKRLQPALQAFDFDVDLMGAKPASALHRPLLLSSRPCRKPVLSFGLRSGSTPADDVADGAPGATFSLAPRAAFGPMSPMARLKLIKATHGHGALSKFLFQALKPIQAELAIARARRAERVAAD